MNGNVTSIHTNSFGKPSYGFILGEDKQDYFFHKSDLVNCSIMRLQEGDSVEFTPAPNKRDPKKMTAQRIRKRAGTGSIQYANPGIHRDVDVDKFNQDEQLIIRTLGKALYVTNGGRELSVAGCNYRYILVKPTENYVVNFNFQREIPVIFSDYELLEPRCLDVAAYVAKDIPTTLRLDRSCQIVISRDNNVEERLGEMLRDSNLSSVVIPFSYEEFASGKMNSEQILDRFRKYLFDSDLFTTSQPIINDVFFFGRRDYALDVATKCKNSSYLCGIFGLRRSGKTSMLYAIQRQLENAGCPVVFIPCQEELDTLDWKGALYRVTEDIRCIRNLEPDGLATREEYEEDAANAFGSDMDTMLHNCSVPVVVMFDEIEAITFGVGEPTGPWYDGNDFVRFWNVLRGYCTRPNSSLSIVVVGTNPMINEIPAIGEARIANPMFQQLSSSNQGSYLKPFDIPSTKTMIDTLGGYMGIKFNAAIPGKLVEDCGGHPYLIRLLCGQIYKYIRKQKLRRPFEVSKAVYEAARAEFEKSNEAESFYLMILEILQTSYPREYDALKILAIDGDGQLSRVLDNAQIVHLTGYGLIEKNGDRFAICYDTVKRFLQGKYVFERTGLNFKDQALEINTRMNDCELRLRALVRRTLNAYKKKIDPKQAILDAMAAHPSVTEKQKKTAAGLDYKELFDPTVNHGCYFLVLVLAIEQNYDTVFSAIFDQDKNTVVKTLKERFNRYRQIPAHPIDEDAKNWSDKEFEQFREDMSWLEAVLTDNE